MAVIRVIYEHQLVAEFPADHNQLLEGGDELVIVDAAGVEVTRYAKGTWSGAGLDLVCSGSPGRGCRICEQPQVSATSPTGVLDG